MKKALQIAMICSLGFHARGQGTFQNLDFESANLSSGNVGTVSISSALPAWNGDLGTTPISSVWQNDFALGDASIDIVGPSPAWGVIGGSYSVDLQAGAVPYTGGEGYETASISQTGLVPANAQSFEFEAVTSGPPTVSLGGDNLTLFPLGSGPAEWGSGYNYTVYGVNVAPFAGQVETLTIAESFGGNNLFDSIQFSPSSVPEPSVIALTAVGGLLCWTAKVFSPRR